jgi:putative ABC transport system permease protein
MIYKALLHLYPKSFRAEYEGEMCAVFARRRRDASGLGVAALWIETLFDVAMNATRVHLDLFGQDLRYFARTVKHSPAYALTVVGIAALGIGATTAAFSIADHVLLRPLPFADADRLATVWEKLPNYSRMELSPANYKDWKAQTKSFEAFGAYNDFFSVNLAGDGEPERLTGAAMTADVLPMIGVKPVIGRWFTTDDDRRGALGTVILSYALWQGRFGGSSSILGKKLLLDGGPYTVVGVMPAQFSFPSRGIDVFLPLRRFGMFDDGFEDTDRTNTFLVGIAKRKRGVSLGEANSELSVIASRLEAQFPKELGHVSAVAVDLRDMVAPQSKTMLWALLGASLCVLLIACANLASLLLARALGRRKELAVRAAMGAGRERLVRQLLTESVLLALCGGVLGMLIAVAAMPLFAALAPTRLPIAALPSVDARVLLFAAGITLLTGLAFGVWPALRATGADLREGSRSGVGGRKETLRGVLVMAEIAASVVLLVVSGLLIRAMLRVQGADPGFRTEHVLAAVTPVTGPKWAPTVPRVAFYKQVLSQVRALPGVESAAYITSLPMVWRGGIWTITVNGIPQSDASSQKASMRFVTPDYFRTLRIPLILGRDVAESDTLASPMAAVVSQSFARQYWPNEDPLGKIFNCGSLDRMVVGVVGDVRVRGLEQRSEPQVYLPYQQVKDGWYPPYVPTNLAIHSTGDPAQLASAVRRIVASADPLMPVTNIRTMDEIVATQTASRRAQLIVLGGFAAIAFLLAAIGIHGLLAYAVSQRTQEIGVRMALGATRGNILGLIVGGAMKMAAAGIIMGVVAAYGSGLELRSLLAGISPNDPDTFVAGIALALTMTAAGSLVPAWRAVRVDPATALRSE